MKILLLLPDGFSETLLTTPLIRCLHRRLPDAQLHAVTGKEGKDAVLNNPFIHQLSVWPHETSSVEPLKAEAFSFVVDLQQSKTGKALAAALAVDVFRPPTRWWRETLYENFGWNFLPKKHLVAHFFEAVASLGIYNDGEGLDYLIPKEAVVQSHDIPHSHHAGFICLAIGGAHDDVRLPVAALQSLCRKINHPVVLLGKREDLVAGEAIAATDPIKIYNACGKFSPAETADLVRQSKLVIGSDAATIQLATALKKELIVVGERDSLFCMAPWYGANYLQQHPSLYDTIPLQKRRLRYHNKRVNVDAIANKAVLRLRRKKEQ